MDSYNKLSNPQISIIKLEKYKRISGSCEPIVFRLIDYYGKPYDLDGCDVIWTLASQLNRREIIITKSIQGGQVEVANGNECVVNFELHDTCNLKGLYAQQIEVIDKKGKSYIPCQGMIEIVDGLGLCSIK